MKLILKKAVVLLLVITLFSGCSFFPNEEEEIAVPTVEQTVPSYKLYTVKKSGVESSFSSVGNVYKTDENTGNVYIEVWTEKYDLLYEGMRVSCNYNGVDYTGTVVYVSSGLNSGTHPKFHDNLKGVGIIITGYAHLMKEGKTVTVYARLAEKSGVLTVPASAVKEYHGKTYVYVWDGLLRHEREVVLGIRSATFYEVVSGLNEGEQVTCK